MTDETRIGNSDREAALAALQQHLTAGRIELEEFDDRSAVVARAKTRSELEPVFADLPEPHALPATPVALTKDRPDWRQLRQHSTGPMGGPLFGRLGEVLVGLSPFIALALFLITSQWWWWLLIPVAGVVVYGNGGHRRRS
jgi:Domain of unknown function (DUF1707)